MTAADEARLVADKSLPVWELPATEGHVVVQLGDEEWAGVRAVPVLTVGCVTDEHNGRRAVVTGRFRAPWWEEGREEHAAYCQMCARLAVFMGMFTPDFDGWQP